MLKIIRYYFRIWLIYTNHSFSSIFNSRFSGAIFITAKVLRIIFFLIFLVIILKQIKVIQGYSQIQMIFFYLSFNLVDTLTQLLFREVYRFRPQIIQGQFDFVLLKPMSSLFRSLFGGADPLDFIISLPLIITLIYFIPRLPGVNLIGVLTYFLLIINALMLSLSFHIFVLALGILTTSVDHGIMIYRDIQNLGRVPIDIYQEPLRGFITFVIPVGIMMTFPPKALMNLLSVTNIVFACAFSVIITLLSLRAWRYALKKYSSASS